MTTITDEMINAGTLVLQNNRGWVQGRADWVVKDILTAALESALAAQPADDLRERVGKLERRMDQWDADHCMHVLVPDDEYERLIAVDPFATPPTPDAEVSGDEDAKWARFNQFAQARYTEVEGEGWDEFYRALHHKAAEWGADR